MPTDDDLDRRSPWTPFLVRLVVALLIATPFIAIILQAIAGKDPRDATTGEAAVPEYRSMLKTDVKGMKIGLPKEYFLKGMNQEVEGAVEEHAVEPGLRQRRETQVEVPFDESDSRLRVEVAAGDIELPITAEIGGRRGNDRGGDAQDEGDRREQATHGHSRK